MRRHASSSMRVHDMYAGLGPSELVRAPEGSHRPSSRGSVLVPHAVTSISRISRSEAIVTLASEAIVGDAGNRRASRAARGDRAARAARFRADLATGLNGPLGTAVGS